MRPWRDPNIPAVYAQVNPAYGFDIDTTNRVWQAFSLIRLNHFMQTRGLTFFLVSPHAVGTAAGAPASRRKPVHASSAAWPRACSVRAPCAQGCMYALVASLALVLAICFWIYNCFKTK